MLAAIESKLAGLVGDGLAARPHLSVQVAPGGSEPASDGKGIVIVSVSGVLPRESFERGFHSAVSASASRRVLPVNFQARLDFHQRPAGPKDSDLFAARSLLLDDVSLTAHLLAAEDVRTGKAFAGAAPDPGYRVLSFALDNAVLDRDLTTQSLTAAIVYRGDAEIWPPGVTQPESAIVAPELVLAAQPIAIRPPAQPVRQGETAELRVGSLPPTTSTRGPLQLAVRVVSDLPLNQRGTIVNGIAGAETGLRILPAGPGETVIQYAAPAGNPGAVREETIEIYLATPEQQRSVLLGAAAVRIEAKAP
jgi:hypothetical protein